MAKEKKKKNKDKKVKEKKKNRKVLILKIMLLATLLLLINIYAILGIMYKNENFTVTLDSENGRESGLVIYEDINNKLNRTFLRSEDISYFTDISIDWLPKNINDEGNGSHNGKNYIAYTFYAENQGQDTINYWSRIVIDDVIKNVDEAIRVMVYRNGERVVYAKPNPNTGEAEPKTTPFHSIEDNIVMLDKVEDFKVGTIDKYTVVIWVEGDDPQCTDDLIGGEIKMHMTLTEEHREKRN